MQKLALTPDQLAEQVGSLFSLPDIALRINELLNQKNTTNEDLEEIIQHDPALTTQLLRLVNSSYYGFPQEIESLSRAISIIGQKELRMLVMATKVVDTFKGIPENLVDMNTFWYHSVTSAVIARLLARQFKQANIERFFIAGLLHSIGKLMFFTQYPKQSAEILALPDQSPKPQIQAEIDTFGFSHAEAGAALLENWGLPQSIWAMIASYLHPAQSEHSVEQACLLAIAADIANQIEPCVKIDLDFEEPELDFNQPAYQYLQLSPEQASEIIQEAVFESFEILSIIRPQAAQIF
jgi:HD-like signal output (HDOD) protein